jgi:hypothetical protein
MFQTKLTGTTRTGGLTHSDTAERGESKGKQKRKRWQVA